MVSLDTRGHKLYWCQWRPAKTFKNLNLAILAQVTHQQQVLTLFLFFGIKLDYFISVAYGFVIVDIIKRYCYKIFNIL